MDTDVQPLPATTLTALLGEAVGDAFGAPFEYHDEAPKLARRSLAEARYLEGRTDCRNPVRRCRLPGLYTDDTQQALLLLWIWRQMQLKGKDPLDANMVGEVFLRVCRRMAAVTVPGGFGVHRGTGQNFRTAVQRGEPPATAGLGAAMRIGPVSTLFEESAQVAPWVAAVSASTTSDPMGIAAGVYFAQVAWATAHQGVVSVPDEVPDEIRDAWLLIQQAQEVLRTHGTDKLLDFATDTGVPTRPLKNPADGFGLTGVVWVEHCVTNATSFEDALERVCSLGGDTDTVCAMAGCLAALRFGRDAIPSWMTEGLLGYEHMVDIDLWYPVQSEVYLTQQEVNLVRELSKEAAQAAARSRSKERRKGGKRS